MEVTLDISPQAYHELSKRATKNNKSISEMVNFIALGSAGELSVNDAALHARLIEYSTGILSLRGLTEEEIAEKILGFISSGEAIYAILDEIHRLKYGEKPEDWRNAFLR